MRTSLVGLGCVLLLAITACREGAVEAGFWFEPVRFDAPRLGGTLTADDIREIEALAVSELKAAFDGLRITFSDRRDLRYRVRVVQELNDPRFLRPVGGAGESRAVAGFGGWGAVSFHFIASGALAYASADTDRAALIRAIGQGIGRTAVHEFTHQLIPTAPIHDSTNVRSYEFASAARREHYYGDMEWDLARPLLEKRLGLSSLFRGKTNGASYH